MIKLRNYLKFKTCKSLIDNNKNKSKKYIETENLKKIAVAYQSTP